MSSRVIYSREELDQWLKENPQVQPLQVIPEKKLFKKMNIGGYEFLSNTSRGIFPVFSYIVKSRIKKQKATNIVTVGEPGEGKTYIDCDIGRVLDMRFTIDQVVFRYGEFIKQVIKLPMGRPIVFDEPSYAMGKREWYKEINQALVKTIESFRFKVHPLLIPIINMNLLDATIRTYLIQFMIEMKDRGLARVFRLRSKQHESGYYHPFLCDLKYSLFDNDQCKKPSCLDCHKVDTCSIFRAQYERKKRDTQDKRYQESLEKFTEKESRELSDKDLESLLLTVPELIVNEKGDPESTLIRIRLEEKWNIKIGRNRSYKIAKELKILYPNQFTPEADVGTSLSP